MNEQIREAREQTLKALEPARQWYAALQYREQVAVGVPGGALILMLVYLLMWKPVLDARQAAVQRYLSQAQVVDWMQDNAEVVRQARSGQRDAPTMRGDWISVINASASRAGLTLRGFTPEGNDA